MRWRNCFRAKLRFCNGYHDGSTRPDAAVTEIVLRCGCCQSTPSQPLPFISCASSDPHVRITSHPEPKPAAHWRLWCIYAAKVVLLRPARQPTLHVCITRDRATSTAVAPSSLCRLRFEPVGAPRKLWGYGARATPPTQTRGAI